MKVMFNGDCACCGIALGKQYTLGPGENDLEDRIGEELIRVGVVVPVESGDRPDSDSGKSPWGHEFNGAEV